MRRLSRAMLLSLVMLFLAAISLAAEPVASANADPGNVPAAVPGGYFDEPANLPFDEEVQERKQEAGWHWLEFRYTSLVYRGEPIRIHAVYAAPDGATAQRKAPAILMTHGIFGAIRGPGQDRYWKAFSTYVQAGFAVLFIDWYPNFAHNFQPKDPAEPKHFTTFGKFDYAKPGGGGYFLSGNDWKDSLHYQVAMAAKRGVTWLQARPEVDGARIGATGASYGGVFSSMFAGLDRRIVAVNPCVYTAGFGPHEQAYNCLGLNGKVLAAWQQRFDSQVLLSKRQVPILYTVGSRDSTFLLTKAMDNFAAMQGPKHLLIGPNAGHEYWAVDQTALFFHATLNNKFQWPTIREIAIRRDGRTIIASGKMAADAPRKVEFFFTQVLERAPGKPLSVPASDKWKWTGVKARETTDGAYWARWTAPDMPSGNAPETPESLAAKRPASLIRVFARVTDKHGAMACSPLSQALVGPGEEVMLDGRGPDR